MGLEPGHVTGSGISHGAQLRALGNGVVPQQAALALQLLGVDQLEVVDELPAAA